MKGSETRTRKASFSGGFYIQEIPVVGSLEEIGEDGLYAVEGWKTPVSVEHVTPYGESQISDRHPKAVFFRGSDGVRRYAIGTGKFEM